MAKQKYSKDFIKEEEAEAAKSTLDKMGKWYCPATMTRCDGRCWCHESAKVLKIEAVDSSGVGWRVRYPRCTNPMYNREG